MAGLAYLDSACFSRFFGSSLPKARSSASGDSSAPTSCAMALNASNCLAGVMRLDFDLSLLMGIAEANCRPPILPAYKS